MGLNIHAPSPSLLPHVCVCGAKDSDPTWHRQPVPTVSPKREPVAVARRTDPETSWEAARSVTDLTQKQNEVLSLIRAYGSGTDEELWAVYSETIHGCVRGDKHMSVSGFRTRRSELVKAGLLRDTGERRVGSTGRRMIVWSA